MIRTAVSLGGSCDTLTCIAGGIAEAFYGIDSHLKQECEARLPDDMLAVLKRFILVPCSFCGKGHISHYKGFFDRAQPKGRGEKAIKKAAHFAADVNTLIVTFF